MKLKQKQVLPGTSFGRRGDARMFRQFCRPVATVEAQGAFLFGWQLSAHVKPAPIRTLADGSDLAYANSFISLLLPAGFLHILRFFSDLE